MRYVTDCATTMFQVSSSCMYFFLTFLFVVYKVDYIVHTTLKWKEKFHLGKLF